MHSEATQYAESDSHWLVASISEVGGIIIKLN